MTNNKSKSELKSEFSENQFISDEHECMEIFNNKCERARRTYAAKADCGPQYTCMPLQT